MTRKSPYRHPVRSYTREGHRVDRYVRGEGKKPVEPTTLLSNNERNNERALGYRRVAERRIPIPERRRVQVGWEEPPAETKMGAKIYYKPIKFKGVERTKYDAQGNFYKYMERVYRKTGEGITRDKMWVKQIPIYQYDPITFPINNDVRTLEKNTGPTILESLPINNDVRTLEKDTGPTILESLPINNDVRTLKKDTEPTILESLTPVIIPYYPIDQSSILPTPPDPYYTGEGSSMLPTPPKPYYTGEGDVPIIPPSRGIIGTDPKWANYYARVRKEQAREERTG